MAKFEKLQRANVEVSNSDETSRKYAITADAQVANGNVENFNNGKVMKGEMCVATLHRWSAQNLNVTFNNVEAEEQCAILAEINAFLRDVEALVSANPITI